MNQIKYKHYREMYLMLSDNGDWYDAVHNLGGYTMAYQELDNGDFLVGVSRCSGEDNFCKSLGRGWAHARLKGLECITVPKEDFLSHMKLVHDGWDMADSNIARMSLGRGKK